MNTINKFLKIISIICLFTFGFLTHLYSQSDAPPKIIGILPFKISNAQQLSAAKQVEAIVYQEIVSSKRVEVVEREFFGELENEKWRQSQVDFIDGSVISKTQSRGAHHLLIGQITSCEVSRQQSSDGGYYYRCDLKVSIRITNIETSLVSITDNWENGLFDFDTGDTEAEAISKSAKSMKRKVKKFLDEYFPIKGEILQLQANGEVIVGVGSNDGIKKNNRLIVFQTSEVAGRVFNKEVGEIQVTAVNGPEICSAKFKKGKDFIVQGLQNNSKFYVKTKL